MNRRDAAAARRAANDAAYRRALGVPDGEPLPPVVGSATSAGAARGARGRTLSKQAKRRRRRTRAQ